MPRAEDGAGAEGPRAPGPSLAQMALCFLRLGALGFGGPVALANTMRKDLAEERHWLTEQEYEDGLAIAAACPGPLAYQLGVYCGYIRDGVAGGLAVAVALILKACWSLGLKTLRKDLPAWVVAVLAKGNDLTVAALKASKKTEGLKATVVGEMSDGMIKVKSITFD